MEREYDYHPKWRVILLGILFFGLCAVVLGMKANGNTSGISISGAIELSPDSATTLYWVLMGLSIAFACVGVALAIGRLALNQQIAYNQDALVFPKARWSRDVVTVPFVDVVEVSVAKASRYRYMKIVYRGGKFTIADSLLPRSRDFDELHKAITDRVRASWIAASRKEG